MPRAPATPELDPAQAALLDLLRRLRDLDYRFTTPTPATHRRVLLRRGLRPAKTLADVFGWNMGFAPDLLPEGVLALMQAAGILRRHGRRLVSSLRVAAVGPLLFLHSAFPTGKDAVFFGPDSYRFADFIRAELPALPPGAAIVDMGAGAGVGGIFAQSLAPDTALTLTDINPRALWFARVNAAFAGYAPQLVVADGLSLDQKSVDVVLANPPYIGGAPGKTYADGGGALGGDISLGWAKAAAGRLAPGGRLLLYSGSAIVRGRDPLRTALAEIAAAAGCSFDYRELDADVFPETLFQRAYWRAERIAAIGSVIVKPI